MMFTDLAQHLKRGFEYADFRQPGIIYFLRHLNCPFARRSLRSFAKIQNEIQQAGFSLIFIHMSADADFREVATKIGLHAYKSISDPDLEYYVAFNVRRARPDELRTWQGIIRQVFINYQMRPSNTISGDLNQMNGLFAVYKNVIHEVYRPDSISEVPDLTDIFNHAKTIVKMHG